MNVQKDTNKVKIIFNATELETIIRDYVVKQFNCDSKNIKTIYSNTQNYIQGNELLITICIENFKELGPYRSPGNNNGNT